MGLKEDLARVEADSNPQCKTWRALRTLPQEDADALQNALWSVTTFDSPFTYELIASILTDNGYPMQGKSVSRHVRNRHLT